MDADDADWQIEREAPRAGLCPALAVDAIGAGKRACNTEDAVTSAGSFAPTDHFHGTAEGRRGASRVHLCYLCYLRL